MAKVTNYGSAEVIRQVKARLLGVARGKFWVHIRLATEYSWVDDTYRIGLINRNTGELVYTITDPSSDEQAEAAVFAAKLSVGEDL